MAEAQNTAVRNPGSLCLSKLTVPGRRDTTLRSCKYR